MKIKLILFLLLGGFLISCSDNDDNLHEEDLPLITQEFLQTYLPNKILSITKYEHTSASAPIYEVKVEGGVMASFLYDGSWFEITAQNGMPESAMQLFYPYFINALNKQDPNGKIVKMYPSRNTYEVSKLIEMSDGNIYADCHGLSTLGLGVVLSEQELPQTVKQFLIRNGYNDPVMYDWIIQMTDRDETIYRVFMYGMILSFDKDGEWIHAVEQNYGGEVVTNSIRTIAEKELPESVIASVNSVKEPLGALNQLSCYKDGVYGFQFYKKALLVDELSGVIEPPVKATNELVNKYFDIKEIGVPTLYIRNPYEYWFTHTYRCNDEQVLYVNMDIDNTWKLVYGYTVTGESRDLLELPVEFINGELPDKVIDYLNTKFIQPKVYSVYRSREGEYTLRINNGLFII